MTSARFDLYALLRFEMDKNLNSLYGKSMKDIYGLLHSKGDVYEEYKPHKLFTNTSTNLTLINGVFLAYFMNNHLRGVEILNWNTRKNYIPNLDFESTFLACHVFDLTIDDVLRVLKENNIHYNIVYSEEDRNYMRVETSQEIIYGDNNFDILIILNKGDDRIDYFLANVNNSAPTDKK